MSIWSDVFNDHNEDEIVFIDGYTSGDHEDGSVIAKVNMKTKEVIYIDERAKTDSLAQEFINEALTYVYED